MIFTNIENNDKISIEFNGDQFRDILEYIKLNMDYSYNKSKKKWIGTATEFLNHRDALSDIDSIREERGIEELAKKERTPETTIIDRNPSRNIFVYPPIKGKEPYKDFQLDSIRKGIKQNRLAYFLQMGLGKSYITITVLNQLFQDESIEGVVIVAPPSGIYNWKRELIKFSTWATEDNIIISGAKHNRNPLQMDLTNIKVIIMTYRHYLTLSDDWYKIVKKKISKSYTSACIPWADFKGKLAIILDESHNIKNPKARQSKVIQMHKDYFNYRYILTGTPTPNDFTEIYNQITFLDSKIIPKSYWNWIKEIADTGNRFSEYAVNFIYPEKQEKYEDTFKPWVVRHMTKDVLDLPELYIDNIYAQMSDLQRTIYEKMVNSQIFIIKENQNGRLEPRRLREKFPYISMVYENALLLEGKFGQNNSPDIQKLINKFDFNKHHGKLEICDSLLDQYINEEKQKVVIFDFHPLTIDLLAERYVKHNPFIIHGGTDDDERDSIIEKFKHSKNCNLLIASFRVLATAINLVECNRVIYFSRDYSYLNWSQSIKRFHRIGQDDQVIINPIIFENSLDEYIEKVIIQKKYLDDTIFQEEFFTKERWKSIFNGNV